MIAARRVDPSHPDAVRLLDANEQELRGLYGPDTIERTPAARPADLEAFVLLYEDEELVAGGAVKRLGDEMGEIKRMFVVPAARRLGHARRLLAELEAVARDLGFSRVRLDTGPEQPHAQALYEASGYAAIENYNANDLASFWGEKTL